MSPYRALCLFTLCFSIGLTARAEQKLVNLSYWNWGEEFQMSRDEVTQSANSNFSALGLEYEFSPTLRTRGWNMSAALLVGQATGGDANGSLIYIASYQPFAGVALKMNWYWRIERRIYLEMGPLALYRSYKWPTSSDGISAVSGSDFNVGGTLSLRIRLSPSLDFCQSFGTLLLKGSSIWSAGLGYRF